MHFSAHLARFAIVTTPFVAIVLSSPLPNRSTLPKSLPVLKLPYASYQASSYNSALDIYKFKNIRYAAPPVGDLRWAKPAPPATNKTLQDGSYGYACVQTSVKGANVLGPGNRYPVGAEINQFLAGIPVPLFSKGNEDCLFLDLYVPGKALNSPSTSKLPVVVWLFGGGYVFGSKDALQPELPLYDGSGLIKQSGGNMIFVAMNYRLGAYGFLAGTTMERDALPNAGLWDQRAVFQWVQDYISLVGGDPAHVTAMGESAGAGSLMHHLVAEGGTLDPLFNRAILQSPAYQWKWDRAGKVEDTFQNFASLAGCSGASEEGNKMTIDCLRAADAAVLKAANKALMDTVPFGSFALGPTADGSFIRQLPILELMTGHYAKSVEAVLLSHCSNEATLFVSGSIASDAQFTTFINGIFPNYTQTTNNDSEKSITRQILDFYPPVKGTRNPTYTSESSRVEAFVRDSCITCNVRYITEGYGDSNIWSMQYSVSPGWHATDLLPTFFNDGGTDAVETWLESLVALLAPLVGPLMKGLSRAMQSYFASFVVTGDPNTNRVLLNLPMTIPWNHPDSATEKTNGVLNVGNFGFSTISDTQNQKTPCDFWRNVAAAVTNVGGYAPPGAVVSQPLVSEGNDPSANYVGGNGNKSG